MKKKNKIGLRYFLFLIGLFLNGFGVAFITKAALGNTPISSIPYTLSLIIPRLSLGNFTIIVSMLLISLQATILRRQANAADILLQIPISFVFGYIIDFSMWTLSKFSPELYPAKLLSLLAGCFIIALGAYFEVTADVTMLPADGFARAVAIKSKWNFGTVKSITDSSQAVIAALLGLIFLHRLAGVREGTVIGALLIGNIVKILSKTIDMERIFRTDPKGQSNKKQQF